MKNPLISTSITPLALCFQQCQEAYKARFSGPLTTHPEIPNTCSFSCKVYRDGAEFWISAESSGKDEASTQPLGGDNIRIILTVADPDRLFDQALKAGATQVFPVGEEHGWRLGRLTDPFGLHWEIGHPVG